MASLSANPLRLSQYTLMTYVLHLQTKFKSPSAMMNYISGACTWVLTSDGLALAFDTYFMKRDMQRMSSHVPAQAPPLLPIVVYNAIQFYSTIGPNHHVLVASLLIGYFTLLRQSNLFYSCRLYDPDHILRARDIAVTKDGLCVRVRSFKMTMKSAPSINILLPTIPSSPYCLVMVWITYVSQTRLPLDGPAFITSDGCPLTARAFIDTLRLALTVAGHPLPGSITDHSLRRGATQACALHGLSLSDIRQFRNWRTNAVYTYVHRQFIDSVPKSLAKSLVK